MVHNIIGDLSIHSSCIHEENVHIVVNYNITSPNALENLKVSDFIIKFI